MRVTEAGSLRTSYDRPVMAYRDDLAAAQAKNDELERELEDAKEKIAQLESPPKPIEQASPPKPRTLASRELAGGVYYDPPQTYVPFLILLVAAARAAWHNLPTAPEIETDSLLLRLGYWALLWPFMNVVWRAVYVVCLVLIVLPWSALVACVATLVLLPLLPLFRLRVGSRRGPAGTGWPPHEFSEEAGATALWILLSITMPPLLPVFIPLLK